MDATRNTHPLEGLELVVRHKCESGTEAHSCQFSCGTTGTEGKACDGQKTPEGDGCILRLGPLDEVGLIQLDPDCTGTLSEDGTVTVEVRSLVTDACLPYNIDIAEVVL